MTSWHMAASPASKQPSLELLEQSGMGSTSEVPAGLQNLLLCGDCDGASEVPAVGDWPQCGWW